MVMHILIFSEQLSTILELCFQSENTPSWWSQCAIHWCFPSHLLATLYACRSAFGTAILLFSKGSLLHSSQVAAQTGCDHRIAICADLISLQTSSVVIDVALSPFASCVPLAWLSFSDIFLDCLDSNFFVFWSPVIVHTFLLTTSPMPLNSCKGRYK